MQILQAASGRNIKYINIYYFEILPMNNIKRNSKLKVNIKKIKFVP